MLIAARGSLIVSDTLIIVLTWYKLFHHIASIRANGTRRRISLADIFLRDGEYQCLHVLECQPHECLCYGLVRMMAVVMDVDLS